MKIIDAHMHLGMGGYDERKILSEMDRKGVESTWLLTWEEIDAPVPELNLNLPPGPLLELAEKHPGRFVPFYAPDPKRADACQVMESFLDKGIRGCAELKVCIDWDDKALDNYLALINRHKLPLVFHMEAPYAYYCKTGSGKAEWLFERLANDKYNGKSRYMLDRLSGSTGLFRKKLAQNRVDFPGILPSFAALEKRLAAFPDINFIGHGPRFWNHISATQQPRYIHEKGRYSEFGPIDRLLEEYGNMYCDLSGTSGYNAMERDREKASLFLDKHASSILYGTDNTAFPLLELLGSLVKDAEKKKAILSGNALRLLEKS